MIIDSNGRASIRALLNPRTGKASKISTQFSERNDGKKTCSYCISALRLSDSKIDKLISKARELKATKYILDSNTAIEISDNETVDTRALLADILDSD